MCSRVQQDFKKLKIVILKKRQLETITEDTFERDLEVCLSNIIPQMLEFYKKVL